MRLTGSKELVIYDSKSLFHLFHSYQLVTTELQMVLDSKVRAKLSLSKSLY